MDNKNVAETAEKIKNNGAFFEIKRTECCIPDIDMEIQIDNFDFINSLRSMALAGGQNGHFLVFQPKEAKYCVLKKVNDYILQSNSIWSYNFLNLNLEATDTLKKFSFRHKHAALTYAFNQIMNDIYANEFNNLNKDPHSTVFICYQENDNVRLNAVLEGEKENKIDINYKMAINPYIFNKYNTHDLSKFMPHEQ